MGRNYPKKFSDNLFTDADEKDVISYKLFLNTADELPFWVSFDPVEKTAYFDTTNKTLDGQTFDFNLQGSDNFTASVKIPFKVTLWSTKPVQKKELQPQFDKKVVKARVNKQMDFELDYDTFQDTENLTVLVSSVKRNNVTLGKYLPKWLRFDDKSLRFVGTPTIDDLDVTYIIDLTATNGYQEVKGDFKVDLIDQAPVIDNATDSLQKQFDQ